jgi:hypothetical protein
MKGAQAQDRGTRLLLELEPKFETLKKKLYHKFKFFR